MSKLVSSQSIKFCPTARASDLSVTIIGEETVVYNQLTHEASCLNAVTTAVWNASNGENDVVALLKSLRSAGFQDANTQVVLQAIELLSNAALLQDMPQVQNMDGHQLNRRSALKSLGKGAALAVPLLLTIDIQPAHANISGCTPAGLECRSGSYCCATVGVVPCPFVGQCPS